MKIRASQQGFSLVELALATMIAAILSLMLYRVLFFVTDAGRRTQSLSEQIAVQSLLYEQFSRDFTAIFVPGIALKNAVEKKQKQKQEVQEQTKEQKKILPIFKAVIRNRVFESLTFFTTHALAVYENQLMPSAVRVRYSLKKNPDDPYYTLYYQSSADRYASIKEFDSDKIRAYPVVDTITTMSVSYLIPKEQKDEEQKKVPEYETVYEWDDQEMLTKYNSLIPAYIRVSLTIGDRNTNRDTTWELFIKVASFDYVRDMLLTKTLPTQTEKKEKEQLALFSKKNSRESRRNNFSMKVLV